MLFSFVTFQRSTVKSDTYHPQNVLESFGMFWKVLECLQTSQNKTKRLQKWGGEGGDSLPEIPAGGDRAKNGRPAGFRPQFPLNCPLCGVFFS